MPQAPIGDQRATAARLRSFRESLLESQASFAQLLYLKRARWTTYEDARVPLPWSTYLALFWTFQIDARWLAIGEGFPLAPMPVAPYRLEHVSPRMPFLQAFAAHRAELYPIAPELPPFSKEDLRGAGERMLTCLAQLAIASPGERAEMLREAWTPELFEALRREASVWLAESDFQEAREKFAARAKEFQERRRMRHFGREQPVPVEEFLQDNLQTLGDPSISDLVQRTIQSLQTLLDRTTALTSAKGGKRRLAEELGVSTSSVSEWLSGRYQPDGKTTLRLLQWVLKEERKNKAPRQ